MAYLARIEPQNAQPLALMGAPANDIAKPDFTPLEWSIIRLASVDGLSTLREPGRFSRFVNWLMGRNGSPELANPRLEALRRISVLSWHFGFTVPGDDVTDFLSAGFSPDQYELLVSSIRRAIGSSAQRIPA
jgi:hypothetical protein